MIGNKTMAQIMDVAKKQNSRLILAGDVRQHQSPQAGDAKKLLIEKSGLPVIKVDKIVRQPKGSDYKKAVRLLADGKIRQGYTALDKMGWVKEIGDPKERQDTLAKAYVGSIKSGRSAMIISPTHIEANEVTKALRQELMDEKLLGKKSKDIIQYKSLNLTDAQKRDCLLYTSPSPRDA